MDGKAKVRTTNTAAIVIAILTFIFFSAVMWMGEPDLHDKILGLFPTSTEQVGE